MDGVSDVKDIVKRAMKWGHKAIAITDHGDVQAFPDANHTVPSDSDFKVIYGVEAYLVDDLKGMVTDSQNQDLDADYVVFDLETTGFSPETNRIIEIGAVKVQNGKIVDKFSTFVNPQVPIPFRIEQLTSINDSMVIDAPVIADILPEFMKFCEGCVMVAHNADFDMSFIKKNCQRLDIPCKPTIVDTVALARVLLPNLNRFKLDTVAKALGVSLENHHRAVDDAGCTAEIFVKFIEMLRERGIGVPFAELIGCDIDEIYDLSVRYAKIKSWLLKQPVQKAEGNSVSKFLSKLDDFDLNEYIKVIKFDELKVPSVPFQIPSSKTYFGIKEMMESELDFLKSTVLSKSSAPVIMYSDMPMKEMAKDPEFPKKWRTESETVRTELSAHQT